MESLVTKIGRFRDGGGVFESLGDAEQALSASESITSDEDLVFRRILTLATVQSQAFRGVVQGRAGGSADPGVEVTFVFDRLNRRMQFWHEN